MPNCCDILIVAGEPSGDMHGARLVRELKAKNPKLNISAMGGEQLTDAGANLIVDAKDLSVVGFVEVIKVLGKLRAAFKQLKTFIDRESPKLVILIDYPGFNLRLAKVAKQAGCKVLYYISPQVWAWHQSRVKKLKRWVDIMAVIFPFEVRFFQQFQVPAKFVGHPLASEPLSSLTTQEAKQQLGFNSDQTVIGLLPGSRKGEVDAILPTLLNTASKLYANNPHYQFVLPRASTIDKTTLENAIKACDAPILITDTNRYTTMQACDFTIATSGTVTLELALLEKPMIIVYKGNPLSFWLAKHLVKLDYIGLPNIVANRLIVPELLQNAASVENITATTEKLLHEANALTEMQNDLKNLHAQLKDDEQKVPLVNIVNELLNDNPTSWAAKALNTAGYQILKESEIIQNTPWSSVLRFQTDKGFVYLKKVPADLFIEPKVMHFLQSDFNDAVPSIIDLNNDEHCFLMDDRGIQLHEYFKAQFDTEILIDAIKRYTTIQIASLNRIDDFLALGVPDWRLEKLPTLYSELLDRENILIEDGLSGDEINLLRKLGTKFKDICDSLSQYQIINSFGHADFHPKNILVNTATKKTTIIDLGEVVITHPFFSLNNCLHMAKENFSLADSQYNQILEACLEPWLRLESRANLDAILALIQQCWSIHAVLAEIRLMESVAKVDFNTLHREGRLSQKLRFWIRECASHAARD